jgi:hypothetical protein
MDISEKVAFLNIKMPRFGFHVGKPYGAFLIAMSYFDVFIGTSFLIC